MAIGDVSTVTVGDAADLHYVDTGMYDVAGYGSVYLLDAERPALIDSGIGTHYERILAAMHEVGIAPADVEVIALTHVHLDHAGGAGFLAEECPNATVAVHERGAPHLVDPSKLVAGTKQAVGDQWQFYTDPAPIPETRLGELTDGDTVDLGDRDLRAHAAPGHAPHQFVYELPGSETVFTADAAGIYVPEWDAIRETSPPPAFDLEQCLDDLDTVRALDPSVLCFGHFGAVPADERLDEYETVLSAWVERVADKRRELADDEAVAEYFGERADAADVWGDLKARAETKMNVRGVLRYLDQRE